MREERREEREERREKSAERSEKREERREKREERREKIKRSSFEQQHLTDRQGLQEALGEKRETFTIKIRGSKDENRGKRKEKREQRQERIYHESSG